MPSYKGKFCNYYNRRALPNIPYLEFITISNGTYRHCIPYNDSTKYLVGTTSEASEFYRY